MVFFSVIRTTLLLVLFASCLYGCARRQPTPLDQLSIYRQRSELKDIRSAVASTPTQKQARSFTPFEEIILSLVFDSLDLLPDIISSKIYGEILNGIEIPDQYDAIDKSVLTSPEKRDIALAAGLIVQLVYGEAISNETTIPQAILFTNNDRTNYADITAVRQKLSSSENRAMDTYNACLSLLVNSLSANYRIEQKSREGLYLRDSRNNLYFHKDVPLLDRTAR